MIDPDSICMEEPLKKLRDLHMHFPHARGGDMTYRFAAYVADPDSEYFDDGDHILPEEFMITWSQAMIDVAAGQNSFSGEQVPAELAMLGATIHSLATLDTEAMADAIFPAPFATAIHEIMDDARTME